MTAYPNHCSEGAACPGSNNNESCSGPVLDGRIRQVAQELGQAHESVIGLTGVYHNLLRRWADA